MSQANLKLVGVSKSYGSVQVLEPVDLSFEDGEFITVLGPSGSGKTTILKMIGGFTEPTSGHIYFQGEDVSRLPAFKRPFNTVFQDYALFPHMRVGQNVGYGLRVRGVPKQEVNRRVSEVLALVGLGDKAARYPNELSGGQRQRVALARAIVCEPKVVLLDEPLAALDAELRRSMQDFLKDLQRRIKTTFVFITHDQHEAISMSDRIVVMNHGRVEQVGTPREIYHRPGSQFVARFFGENNLLPGTVESRANGEIVVDSALGRIRLDGSRDVGPGNQVTLAVRPEHIQVKPQSHLGDGFSTDARIGSLDFLGATSQVTLVLPAMGDTAVRASLPTTECLGLAAGDRVKLAFSLDNLTLLR
ncbi:ABC transporter ATP-binding protein [Paraburkholderia tropica]|uniref:ABC transporter ATP-binding protein n=1 Tax=Paraburkholderia tropica TaxID=92647 RepID=UPI00160D66D3|nr:ABC transporter ATP-binding protein [Paraburkholderia tropica]MBB2981444.1 spermidine/putrescine transport system ATP-binding protein [Paraburkholderia tropica]